MNFFKRKPKFTTATEQNLYKDNRTAWNKITSFIKWYLLVDILLWALISQVMLYMVLSGRYEFRNPITDKWISPIVVEK